MTLARSHIPVSRPPFVKICGLTDPANARDCARAGADAVGLVFFEKSPRNLTLARADQIVRALPSEIMTCGVFVNASFGCIMKVKEKCRITAVQLHGTESPELAERLVQEGLFVVKALFAARKPGLTEAKNFPRVSCFLVESGRGVLPGGNAQTWDYTVCSGLGTDRPVLLAGGLSPANVRDALTLGRPWGLDVSSGVEKAPGIKDIRKVEQFITLAKAGPPPDP